LKGLELAEKYYFEIGRPAIEKELPEALPFLAAGLCGDGSDCLGFDDAISRDHDFGPGFCLWLDDDMFERFGDRLQTIYDSLPASFDGIVPRKNDPNSGKRVGVFRINDYFKNYLGTSLPPETIADWSKFKEYRLAQCVSGKVFEDGPEIFSAFRAVLLSYYPERLRIVKIMDKVHLVSQSGQYNYARCMERGDVIAADICLHEFLRNVIGLVHLLDRKYEPYYKWSWRSFISLPDASPFIQPLTRLLELPHSKEAWSGSWGPGLNLKDEKILLIESVCRNLLSILRSQNLTNLQDSFLDAHLGAIASHMDD